MENDVVSNGEVALVDDGEGEEKKDDEDPPEAVHYVLQHPLRERQRRRGGTHAARTIRFLTQDHKSDHMEPLVKVH